MKNECQHHNDTKITVTISTIRGDPRLVFHLMKFMKLFSPEAEGVAKEKKVLLIHPV